MFVEHKEQGEVSEAPAKVLKLSEIVREHGYGERYDYADCVLGRAYRAWTGGNNLLNDGHLFDHGNAPSGLTYTWKAAKTFGLPFEVVSAAEKMCLHERAPHEIADWLEAQGF